MSVGKSELPREHKFLLALMLSHVGWTVSTTEKNNVSCIPQSSYCMPAGRALQAVIWTTFCSMLIPNLELEHVGWTVVPTVATGVSGTCRLVLKESGRGR